MVGRMRVSRWLVLGAFGFGAGCADILGIDDGIPRTYDASLEASSDAAPDAKDAAVDNFVPLHCGSITCNFGAGESCCWDGDGGFACDISPTACNGTYIPCDRSEQCAQGGDAGPIVCCGHYVSAEGGAVANDVACLPASQCTSAASRFVLCGDDSGAECPADASCQLSAFTLPTFLFCR